MVNVFEYLLETTSKVLLRFSDYDDAKIENDECQDKDRSSRSRGEETKSVYWFKI